jgi:hypothetical protein
MIPPVNFSKEIKFRFARPDLLIISQKNHLRHKIARANEFCLPGPESAENRDLPTLIIGQAARASAQARPPVGCAGLNC